MGVELEDREGHLNQMLSILAKGGIDVHYIYSFVIRVGQAPVMVFNTDDYEKAAKILKDAGIRVVNEV